MNHVYKYTILLYVPYNYHQVTSVHVQYIYPTGSLTSDLQINMDTSNISCFTTSVLRRGKNKL